MSMMIHRATLRQREAAKAETKVLPEGSAPIEKEEAPIADTPRRGRPPKAKEV